jgi:hypothetical protein
MDYASIVKSWANGEEVDVTPAQRRVLGLIATGCEREEHLEAAGREFSVGIKACADLPRTKGTVGQFKAAKEEEYVLDWIISTSARDRGGDVVNQDGWNFKNYKKNPIVLWGHGASWSGKTGLDSDEPIGFGFKFRKEAMPDGSKATIMSIRFAVEESERAARKFFLAKGNFINAGSVGLMPEKVIYAESEEEREKLGLGKFGVYYDRQELLEFSLCAIPMHQDALKKALDGKSITSADAEFLKAITDPTERELEKWARARAKSRICFGELQRALSESRPTEHTVADATLKAIAESQRSLATAVTDLSTQVRELRLHSGPSSVVNQKAGDLDFEKVLNAIKKKV